MEGIAMRDKDLAIKDLRTKQLFVPIWVDDLTQLTPNALRVYMHLSRRADNVSGIAWPSYQSIGDHCFSSVSENKATRRTFARRAIAELLKANVITKDPRQKDDGSQGSNGYCLVDPVSIKPMPINTPPGLLSTPPMPIGTKGTPDLEGTPVEGLPIKNKESSPRNGSKSALTNSAVKHLGDDAFLNSEKQDDRDGRLVMELLRERGFVYLDRNAKALGMALEQSYTDAQINEAINKVAEAHTKMVHAGKRGITAPIAYMQSILRNAPVRKPSRAGTTVTFINQYDDELQETTL